ncbi:MAG: hypothetical protein F6K55_04455 [Moorea sp. SIO4A3]|nr:hypothetical protein [Moorena sp. SIO4A3]
MLTFIQPAKALIVNYCLLLAYCLKKWCVTGLLALDLEYDGNPTPNAPYAFASMPIA